MNPGVVYAAISGLATTARIRRTPLLDIVARAYSDPDRRRRSGPQPSCRVGSSVGDIIAGQAGRDRHPRRAGVQTNGTRADLRRVMVDGLFAVLEDAIARYTITGTFPDR